ncbi:MAG: family 10 glycosylhydrolase, partial [Ekhidna sp.]|nr:family 10 glycosylhydrolase [Ekhidna sp.]
MFTKILIPKFDFKPKKLTLAALLALLMILCGCNNDGQNTMVVLEGREILSFRFEGTDPISEGVIDAEQNLITVTVPNGTDRKALEPTITVSEGASVEPASNAPQNFTNAVVYTVTAQNELKNSYTVILKDGPSSNARLESFSFPDLFLSEKPANSEFDFSFDVPFGTDVSQIEVNFTPEDPLATVEPVSGTVIDFTNPVSFLVTSSDGNTTQKYTVRFTVNEQETGIRGVWMTNVNSNVLGTNQGILDAVNKLHELNFNTIFVVTYNKALTTYPSQVMKDLTGSRIDPRYEDRDPLRELIDAAHAKGIKVFAWFEYGFAAFNGRPGPILEAKPEWAAMDVNRRVVVKNGFYWLNTLLPEVQNFITDLTLEVVRNYPDIDGVQGDDRLPAMPSEAGYDEYTANLYRQDNGGQDPPTNRIDRDWLEWRAERVNDFAKKWYDTIKVVNPNCLVSLSPSPLNFGYREYLQDYETWVAEGYCDMVHPQLYRRDSQG